MSPPKNKAPRAGGALQNTLDLGTEQQGKRTGGRRENQGLLPERNVDQRAPRWSEPPESAAMRMLAALWGKS